MRVIVGGDLIFSGLKRRLHCESMKKQASEDAEILSESHSWIVFNITQDLMNVIFSIFEHNHI